MNPRVEHRGFRHPFLMGCYYVGGVGDLPRTVTDLAMSSYSAQLRSKPSWWEDYRKKEIRQEWKTEGLQNSWTIRSSPGLETITLTPKQIDYVLDELEGYAALIDHVHQCQVSCFERIWESKCVLGASSPETLEQGILDALRTTTLSRRDGGITDLIDPFLNALVFGKTPVYDLYQPGCLRCQPAPLYMRDYSTSKECAFLPTDFSVSGTGQVAALSYINNLDPRQRTLYRDIELLLERCLPLFSHVLTDLHRNNPLYQRIKGPCKYTEWNEPEPPDHSDDEEGWANYERDVRLWIIQRPILLPDVPPAGYRGGLESRRHNVDLSGRTLQVVVHAYDILLSPSNPAYDGTPWHVAGMMNEKIVACAFVYLSAENITGGSIEFRMAVTSPSGFEPGDVGATMRTWAMKDGDPCHQYLGSRYISPGLCIAFPNLYQHRQSSLRLLDPTKEGHQRVVAFYLVDPDVSPVISTARVPPQQKAWIKTAAEESMDTRLPVEIIERIIDEVDGKMSEAEADLYRERMLEERDRFRTMNDQYHFCVPFDIWASNSLH